MKIESPKLIELIQKALEKPLPGISAQKKMFPTQDDKPFREITPSKNARNSSVLLLLDFDIRTGRPSILFTLRSTKLKKHSGQISFPGGRADEGETVIETALRETEEEVGIRSKSITILGELTSVYIPPSNSMVFPVVAYLSEKTPLKLNPDEVSEAFFIELGLLMNPDTIKFKEQFFPGTGKALVPFYDVHNKTPLWGATAIILAEFLELIKKATAGQGDS